MRIVGNSPRRAASYADERLTPRARAASSMVIVCGVVTRVLRGRVMRYRAVSL